MQSFVRAVDALNEQLGRATAWLLWIMAILSVLVVVLRYAAGIGAIALQETILYLHATVFMVGAAYTLRHNAHVRVDIFYQRFSPRVRSLVEIGGALLFLLPVTVFIFWSSLDYVAASWRIHEVSPDGGLPYVYVLKTLLLVMPVLLALQGLAEIVRHGLFLAGRHPELHERELGEL
ncbi:MAG: TRAP transporter small permease subunit [Pseudomonadota bacterium]